MLNGVGTRINTGFGKMNGVAIGLAYTLVNNALALLISFGVDLNNKETASLLAFTNTALLLVSYLSHNAAKHSKTVIPAPPIDESNEISTITTTTKPPTP